MFSSRRLVLLLALGTFAGTGLHAQSSSSSAPPAQQPTTSTPNSGSLSVQARIRARREQRRLAAIQDVYSHLYEAYVGGGYLRFNPGPSLQRLNEYTWDVGVTRYFNQRLGVTIDGRGTYGTAYVPINETTNSAIVKPAISQYEGMIGPTYRFILHPRYSISGRILAGGGYGHFSSDLGSFTPAEVGLYADGPTIAVSAGAPIEYNLTPTVGLRVVPEYLLTNFGSTTQNSLGFTAGFAIRWGKQ